MDKELQKALLLKKKNFTKKSFEFQGKISATETKNDEDRKIFDAVISTSNMDRDRDIIISKGADISKFLENPVIMDGHNMYAPPVGKALEVVKGDDSMTMKFVFADTEQGNLLEYLYTNGYMKAFSVGFLYKEWDWAEEVKANNGNSKVTYEYEDGSIEIDLEKNVGAELIVSKWELLEVSAVNVGANQDALLREAKAFSHNIKNSIKGEVRKSLSNAKIDALMVDMISKMEEITEKATDTKSAVPVMSTEVSEEEWNMSDARVELAIKSSSDGSGEKETIDWGMYVEGFGWFNEEIVDDFTSYLFIHHTVSEDTLVAVKGGVIEAMGELLTNAVIIPDDDKRAVYDHLVNHFVDLEIEAPEFKEYTQEEYDALFDNDNQSDEEQDDQEATGEETGDGEEKTTQIESFTAGIKTLSDKMNDTHTLAKSIANDIISINLKMAFFNDVVNQLRSEKTPEVNNNSIEADLQAMKDFIADIKK